MDFPASGCSQVARQVESPRELLVMGSGKGGGQTLEATASRELRTEEGWGTTWPGPQWPRGMGTEMGSLDGAPGGCQDLHLNRLSVGVCGEGWAAEDGEGER